MTDTIDTIPIIDETRFRLHMRARENWVLLTYKTHINKEEYKTFFNEKCPKDQIYICHENGKNDPITPYEHSHVLMIFYRNIDFTGAKCFDYNGIHPHIRKILSKKKDGVINYITKEDKSEDLSSQISMLRTRINMVEDNTTAFETITDCKTIQEAMNLASRFSDASGIISMFRTSRGLQDPKDPKPITLQPWQEQLENTLQQNPDPRKIIWIFDKTGNTGKTQFTKYYYQKYGCIVMKQFGGAKDSATIIQRELEKGWDKKVLIADLPRKAETHSIYEPLESIKDGCITAVKYEGSTSHFTTPHVVVFCNFPPDVMAMSFDRWQIYEIIEGIILPRHWSDYIPKEEQKPQQIQFRNYKPYTPEEKEAYKERKLADINNLQNKAMVWSMINRDKPISSEESQKIFQNEVKKSANYGKFVRD